MLAATLVFWMGAKKYVHVPPAPPNPDSFTRVARTALLARVDGGSRPGLYVAYVGVIGALYAFYSVPEWGFVISACTALVLLLAFGSIGTAMQLERARGIHPDHAVEGVRSVLRILVIFALVTPFFSLFDQKASTWIVQAESMTKPEGFLPSQMQALNPLLVMLLIPFNNLVLYPSLQRFGWQPTALRRMTAGIGFSSLSWIVIGMLQLSLDSGNSVSIFWQILPYALLTLGEVLVSATGLEFAYSQAPASMKGAIMSFWNLSTTVGNLWVLIVNKSVMNEGVISKIGQSGISVTAFQMFFFAAFAAVAMLAFGLYARNYKMVDNYRQAAVPGKA